ncbi:sulfurtransferase [Bacillus sp. B15-48]|uniref:sulfurtransferase n=1 Tax=Bacillus sp. B15-48 TaxID=1548601 RepID=UPI0019400F31|nr:sulfurtransferase [Bacillus sp. B15-48]MBM4761142.1 sulfurtransferase [Bacillus sp. B15-48]
MIHIVNVSYVMERLNTDQRNFAIVDCRFALHDSSAGKQAYEKDHLPGAVFIDLEKDLSSPVREHGGRHPLPDFEKLADTLGKLGIDQETEVIAYDDQGGMFAARFWWLLKVLGHERVAVLDGGYGSWIKAGLPINKEIPQLSEKQYTPAAQSKWEFVTAEQVKEALNQPGLQLIDSREQKRYFGLEEPIDKVAGHIPGAVNFFWKDVLTTDGMWKSEEELQSHFASLDPSKETIVYCGSGVSACPNILALNRAGFKNVKLYAGSWSDWISYPENC